MHKKQPQGAAGACVYVQSRQTGVVPNIVLPEPLAIFAELRAHQLMGELH